MEARTINSTVRTPRKRRFIAQLLKSPTSVQILRPIVEASNIPQLCANLRGKGWKVHTERMGFIDRDGEKVKPVVYWLDESQKEYAGNLLASHGTVD